MFWCKTISVLCQIGNRQSGASDPSGMFSTLVLCENMWVAFSFKPVILNKIPTYTSSSRIRSLFLPEQTRILLLLPAPWSNSDHMQSTHTHFETCWQKFVCLNPFRWNILWSVPHLLLLPPTPQKVLISHEKLKETFLKYLCKEFEPFSQINVCHRIRVYKGRSQSFSNYQTFIHSAFLIIFLAQTFQKSISCQKFNFIH